jgi:hypothetical protein
MNLTLVVHALPQSTPLSYNQAVVTSYDEDTLGEVHLVVEAVATDVRVPNDCAVFGYANELGVITQIASIENIADIFGVGSPDFTRELRDMTRGLVAALV